VRFIISGYGAHTVQVCCCPSAGFAAAASAAVGVGPEVHRAPAFVEAAEVYGSGKHQQEEFTSGGASWHLFCLLCVGSSGVCTSVVRAQNSCALADDEHMHLYFCS
jgi:hypothetical protein